MKRSPKSWQRPFHPLSFLRSLGKRQCEVCKFVPRIPCDGCQTQFRLGKVIMPCTFTFYVLTITAYNYMLSLHDIFILFIYWFFLYRKRINITVQQWINSLRKCFIAQLNIHSIWQFDIFEVVLLGIKTNKLVFMIHLNLFHAICLPVVDIFILVLQFYRWWRTIKT